MYKLDSQYIGYPRINDKILAPASAALLAALLRTVPNPSFIARADDKVWGAGEFIFGRAGGVIPAYQLCSFLPVWDSALKTYIMNFTPLANTVNLGREVAVNQAGAMAAGDFGWFMVTGLTPVDCTATIAADVTFSVVAAGQGGALAASKQIVGARIVTPATQTVVSASKGGNSGENTIVVDSTDGFFKGGFLSGTGVGAASRVTDIDEQNGVLSVSVVNSAAVTGNVTITYNNATIFYNVARLNRSFAQGAIT